MQEALLISSLLLWVIVLLNLALTLAIIRRMRGGASYGLKKAQVAPDFKVQTLGGDTVSLADYRGRSVAFILISPTCEPCRKAIPTYESLRDKAARSGVDLVLVSNAEAEPTGKMVEEFGMTLPVLVAPRGTSTFTDDYKLPSTPSYCLIDAGGKVVSTGYPGEASPEWKKLADAWEASMTRAEEVRPAERR